MTSSSKKGFTLVELMVVIGMIGVIMAAMTSSVTGAQKRAQISKAESEVKVISQAILAYENYDRSNELPSMTDRDADSGALSFLLGDGGSAQSGGKIPTLLMAQLKGGGAMKDPWNTPYKITIKARQARVTMNGGGSMQTGFYFPNYYRLSLEERQ